MRCRNYKNHDLSEYLIEPFGFFEGTQELTFVTDGTGTAHFGKFGETALHLIHIMNLQE